MTNTGTDDTAGGGGERGPGACGREICVVVERARRGMIKQQREEERGGRGREKGRKEERGSHTRRNLEFIAYVPASHAASLSPALAPRARAPCVLEPRT